MYLHVYLATYIICRQMFLLCGRIANGQRCICRHGQSVRFQYFSLAMGHFRKESSDQVCNTMMLVDRASQSDALELPHDQGELLRQAQTAATMYMKFASPAAATRMMAACPNICRRAVGDSGRYVFEDTRQACSSHLCAPLRSGLFPV